MSLQFRQVLPRLKVGETYALGFRKLLAMRSAILPCLLLGLSSGFLSGQSLERHLLAPGGNYYQDLNWSMEWSVGEPAVQDWQAGDLRLTEGFQQGNALVTAVFEQPPWSYEVELYPNPVQEVLILRKTDTQLLTIRVFDVLGQLILEDHWPGDTRRLDVHSWQAGIYLLTLKDEAGAFASYRFLKP